jgi:ubiquinone/menaquinone biosynthesis C-methylase UbiE
MTALTDTDRSTAAAAPKSHGICPWWMGYALICPLRRLVEDPMHLLAPLVTPGTRVLDFGASMGYFSIPAARLAGSQGQVVCVDLSAKALAALRRRARRAGVAARIETVLSQGDASWVEGRAEVFDVALAMHVLHELPDAKIGLARIAAALRPGGKLLVAEPRGHVSETLFDEEIAHARSLDLTPTAVRRDLRRAYTALFVKPTATASTPSQEP